MQSHGSTSASRAGTSSCTKAARLGIGVVAPSTGHSKCSAHCGKGEFCTTCGIGVAGEANGARADPSQSMPLATSHPADVGDADNETSMPSSGPVGVMEGCIFLSGANG